MEGSEGHRPGIYGRRLQLAGFPSRSDPTADSDRDRLYGMAWLSTALLIVATIGACVCAVLLLRRRFIKHWQGNDAKLRYAQRRLHNGTPRPCPALLINFTKALQGWSHGNVLATAFSWLCAVMLQPAKQWQISRKCCT